MDFRIVPVGPRHGRLEIVDHQSLRHAAEMTEGILQARDERFRGLMPHRLAIRLPAVAQHDAEDPRAADLAVGHANRRPGAEVHLGLLARLGLHPPKWQRRLLHQSGDESPHTVVARGAFTVVFCQVLVDSLGQKALLDFRQDELAEWFALATRPAGRSSVRAAAP